MKTLVFGMAALALAGCTCMKAPTCCKDPMVGNWGLKLGYDDMNAGHMIISRDADGKAQALVLWRWASPTPMKNVVLEGKSFSFDHPWGFTVKGRLCGPDFLKAVAVKKNGLGETSVIGWRNPAIEPASTADAVLGEPIDLLKDGLAGWKAMDTKAPFGWSMKTENGEQVLSNCLPVDDKGKKRHGSNLMTLRNDFYDFNLAYDVRVPKDSNSGVYLRGRYEIQTLDSYGKPVDMHNMAAYYGRVTPSVAAEKPAGEWQHVDVTLYKRHLTVVLNGTTIIDNAPVVGITGGAIDANEFVKGPIYLQGDHSDADYKNMILRPCVK